MWSEFVRVVVGRRGVGVSFVDSSNGYTSPHKAGDDEDDEDIRRGGQRQRAGDRYGHRSEFDSGDR